ncbi:hypothetical protein PT7_1968 [Pusillimonas sp. T7-7]|nr:hypothetical protein PT7_1968 [Pusillimonas sp. T7-7]
MFFNESGRRSHVVLKNGTVGLASGWNPVWSGIIMVDNMRMALILKHQEG